MKTTIWNKKIPTILGIGIITISILLTSILANTTTRFHSNAMLSETPQDITVTNISTSSFTVSYITESQTISLVSYGKKNSEENVQLEDLDKEKGISSSRKIHSITLDNLEPKTKYYFTIISGQTTFLNNNLPFEATTSSNIMLANSTKKSIKGNVILPNGDLPYGAIAYLTAQNSQTLSSLIKKDGSFDISLDTLLSKDLSSHIEIDNNTLIKIAIINDSFRSNVWLFSSKTNFIPTITLSNDYDFTLSNSIIPFYSDKSISGFPLISSSSAQPSATQESKISSP